MQLGRVRRTPHAFSYAGAASVERSRPKGVRKRRRLPLSRRACFPFEKTPFQRVIMPSKKSKGTQAPLLWRFKTGMAALGIHVDDNLCWIGNENGRVYALDHEAKVVRKYKLP